MISPDQIPELRRLYKAERQLPFADRPDLGSLLVFAPNSGRAVHQWFKYKEAFSADLLAMVLSSVGIDLAKPLNLLDPYCGVATSLVSAQLLSGVGGAISATGIEVNPFSAFVARTKTQWPLIDPDEVLRIGAVSLKRASRSANQPLPTLSSIASGRCISHHFAQRILSIRDAIRADGASPAHDAALLGLAAAIEPISRVRRDGRALRLVTKPRQSLDRHLAEKWSTIAADCRELQVRSPRVSTATIHLGDGRRPTSVVAPGSIDLIVTSPPYPNNIDYNEVYKLELWLLGFTHDAGSFLGLRRSSFRSHPTCSELSTADDDALLESLLQEADLRRAILPIVQRVDGHPERTRRKVIRGYLLDTLHSLREQYTCLRPGGVAVHVVGNSLHGNAASAYVIPTDLIVAMMARAAGFSVENVLIARALRRRLSSNHFLRESIVVLRKP